MVLSVASVCACQTTLWAALRRLSICKGIIAAHGGTFHLDSEVGRGTNVTIRMPADQPVTQTEEHLYSLELRTSGDPAQLATAVRQALGEVEPGMPIVDINPLALRVSRQLSQDRLVAQITSVFGAIALLLACLGLYGTISYGVTRRSATPDGGRPQEMSGATWAPPTCSRAPSKRPVTAFA